MRLVLLGLPGSGKGTQGELLARHFHIPRLSVGALIRRHVAGRTPEGAEAESYMVKGLGIPGAVWIQMVKPWLLEHGNGFVVDNLVRTQDQLREYQKFEQDCNFRLTKVLYLKLSQETSFVRLQIRRMKTLRPDETEQAVRARMETFYQNIGPIVAYFQSQGIYAEIKADETRDKVFHDILSKIIS